MRTVRPTAIHLLLALVVLVTGCASKPPAQAPTEPPVQPAAATLAQQPPITPRQRAELHVDLAAGYYERGQMDIALEELAGAEKLDPSLPRIYNIYGLIYAMLGENQKAEASFQRALSLAPTDSEIRHNWGWFLCTHGRPAESIPEFEQAIRNPLYKSPEVALVNAGKCSVAIGNTAAAGDYFRRALAAQPGNPVAAYNLALLDYRAGQYPSARNLMRIVMQETNPPPEALFLGLCVERKLGDRAAEQSYTTQLRNRYPDSGETRAIGSGGCE